ncbi:MAG: radical SAM protein [Proteobacteria bacterium]|nr:radical SAM protein [Pseudomonadota bacterium]
MDNKLNSGYRYIFGPVPSRRLGISLGVDLLPAKTCTLDCIYCECGRTGNLTLERKEYVPVEKVKSELRDFLSQGPKLDFVTFSGSGEPTLHKQIGDLIRFLKSEYPKYNVAVLTNGTLLFDPEVRTQVLDADVVKVSLDAGSAENFIHINRPHQALEMSRIIDGLISFREIYSNQLWVEVFIVKGLNDKDTELKRIRDILKLVRPDRIHLNTLDRPGTETWVEPVEESFLTDVAGYLCNARVVDKPDTSGKISGTDFREFIISTVKRRPCTAEDVSRILNIHENDAKKHLDKLHENGEIKKISMPRGVFYFLKRERES